MSEILEIAIVGAGPGGLGAAANAAHHGLSHILFEKREIANTIYDYQLRKLVMAEPGRLPLRAHVEFTEGSREEVLDNFEKSLREKNVEIFKGAVDRIVKQNGHFVLSSAGRDFKARHVVLAIGNMGSPRKMGAPGEDLPHIAYCHYWSWGFRY
jgi:cGMP-dependent protein kinase 2